MPARPSIRAARMLACSLAAIVVTALTGCAQMEAPRFDPQRDDVVTARGEARLATADALATVTGGRLTTSSARIDSCAPGEDNWKNRDPWALRCYYNFATALPVADIEQTAAIVADGLEAQGCEDPGQLADQLARWSELNPGEPEPGDPNFRAGVIPPILTTCADIEIWIRISTPDDALLAVTAAEAANTTDPTVVTAQPFTAADVAELRAIDDEERIVLFVTARQLYHQEPR